MTTKPPPQTASFADDTLESIAYQSVQSIPAREPNDLNRLGYSVWAWLKERRGTLDDAVRNSGVRSDLAPGEISRRIARELQSRGVQV